MNNFKDWLINWYTGLIGLVGFVIAFVTTQNKNLITGIAVSVAVIIVKAVSALIKDSETKEYRLDILERKYEDLNKKYFDFYFKLTQLETDVIILKTDVGGILLKKEDELGENGEKEQA